MSAKNCAQYTNKVILGPMVRIGTLAFRLLSLRYGADLVYSEEIIDWRLLRSKRIVNEEMGIIEYIDESDGTTIFSTCSEEKSKVILQLGTSDPERALKVGLLVQDDIAGIDINMGCPKDFSLKGGMGAALLKQPEKVQAILTTLVSNLRIPVTCKIRVLATVDETIKFSKMIQSCGVSAMAIHGRMVHERPQHANRSTVIRQVASELDIPVIANGGSKEITKYEDIARFRETTGCSSVMLARAAEWNASIFRPDGKIEMEQVIKAFLIIAVDKNNPFTNSKYTVQNMLREQQETPLGKRFLATQTMEDLCNIWDLKDHYNAKRKTYELYRGWNKHKADNEEHLPSSKKTKLLNESEKTQDSSVITVPACIFIRGHYATNELPKSVLVKWARENRLAVLPAYSTECTDKRFRSVVSIGGQNFMTDLWEKNKKQAEQAAAMACIKAMKIS
ncbi:tRNA-dihydrouridine(20) synthase [NAD(P)+]-like [Orchesella cincta]|uniref:tRNA-dihydrouridine(20) synthase [NAD(P)+]-like n=1 Tax=Orchesella cincta TaxID=48709 RepID=A0A1D2MQW5_ORCCI|nr:tRNA-dihydrouridine(20) synthase [NAD(P)+]-like [Orchesella cincta]